MRKSSKFEVKTESNPTIAQGSLICFTLFLALLPYFMDTELPSLLNHTWGLSSIASAPLSWRSRYRRSSPSPIQNSMPKHALHSKFNELTHTSCGFSSSSPSFERTNLWYCHFLAPKTVLLTSDGMTLIILFPRLQLNICLLLSHYHTARCFRWESSSYPAIACY